jgi:hypothetical protein
MGTSVAALGTATEDRPAVLALLTAALLALRVRLRRVITVAVGSVGSDVKVLAPTIDLLLAAVLVAVALISTNVPLNV